MWHEVPHFTSKKLFLPALGANFYPQVCGRTFFFVPKPTSMWQLALSPPPTPARPSPLRYRALKQRGGGKNFFFSFWGETPQKLRDSAPLSRCFSAL